MKNIIIMILLNIGKKKKKNFSRNYYPKSLTIKIITLNTKKTFFFILLWNIVISQYTLKLHYTFTEDFCTLTLRL